MSPLTKGERAVLASVVVLVALLVFIAGPIVFELVHCSNPARHEKWVQENLPESVFESRYQTSIRNGSLYGSFTTYDSIVIDHDAHVVGFTVTNHPNDSKRVSHEEFTDLLTDLFEREGWPAPEWERIDDEAVCLDVI